MTPTPRPSSATVARPLTLAKVAMPVGLGLLVCIALVVLVPLAGGGVNLRVAFAAGPWAEATNVDALIFWGTRVPRVVLGVIVGGSLALTGLVLQAVLRNPLAEPYILGISTGASLGRYTALALATAGVVTWPLFSPVLCFVGALAPMLILQILAGRHRRFSAITILLGGVMLNVFFTSLILLVQFLTDFTQVRSMVLWMMGALDVVGWREVLWAAPVAAVCAVAILFQSRALNLLSLGEMTAGHLGIDVRRTVARLLWIATFLTSVMVSVSGPIGFVGLLVPHGLRLIFGADNRLLAPLCVVWGGVFLVVCDFIGWRGLAMLQATGLGGGFGGEIPIGVVTSVLGAPAFLWLLLRERRGE